MSKQARQLVLASFLLLLLISARSPAGPLDLPVGSVVDDGVELDDLVWDAAASRLTIGRDADGVVHDVGLRFLAEELRGVEDIMLARLRFSARGGAMGDSMLVRVTGVLETDPAPLSADRRPSQLPRTSAVTTMTIRRPWLDGGTRQHFYYTADLAPVLEEILAQPDWGQQTPALILCVDVETESGQPGDHVICSARGPGEWPVTLQIVRTLEEAFSAGEIVGRPTDRTATVNLETLVPMELFVEYEVDGATLQTPVQTIPADTPSDILMTDLQPDAVHPYRLRYRAAGSTGEFAAGQWRRVRTQRPPGSSFRVTIQADSHLWDSYANNSPDYRGLALYRQTVANVRADQPDLHFSMGDYTLTEYSLSRRNAFDRYLHQRDFLDSALHSVPMYLVIGNHEGELGYLVAEQDSIAWWAEEARRAYVPNPYPDGFYSGCQEPSSDGEGWRESYYAWEWGDALFVVIDPYWYTTERPFHNPVPANGLGWNWTLGHDQYEWLHETLHATDCRWRFVFTHQLVGGIGRINEYYGRGGIEAVAHHVAGNASFEWGGENDLGLSEFAMRRPGWEHGPIHDMLVDAGVTAVLFGHDHFYARQELDGIVYLTVPQPHDHWYAWGGLVAGQYTHGVLLPNSGHVRLDITPHQVVMEYIRSFLPGDGDNGGVADRHVVVGGVTAAPAPPVRALLSASPNPSARQTVVRWHHAAKAAVAGATLEIHDVRGRLVRRLPVNPDGTFHWDQCDGSGRPVASGTYHGRLRHGTQTATVRLAVVR